MTQPISTRVLLIGAAAAVILAAGSAALVSTSLPRLGLWTLDPTDPRVSLDDVEREVSRRYAVPDIDTAKLAGMLDRQEVTTLFDVRTQEEYDAGHLPGAVRIEPGSSAADILAAHRDKLNTGPVVFYCAVGVRSSQIMMATLREIAPLAAGGVHNLRGGVFRWASEGRPLLSGTDKGQAHPFDANWGQLLARTLAR